MVLSSYASTSVEDVAKVATTPVWFQLYVYRDRGFTRDLVQRAQSAGCRALALLPIVSDGGAEPPRSFQFRAASGARLSEFEGTGQAQNRRGIGSLCDNCTWKDVEWQRSFSNGPILLKGILDPDHVEKAVKSGASGIIVSNHGGRNLDTVPATIDALPRVTDRVEGRVPVLMDGGIRSGTDYSKPWPTARARSLSVVRICMASPSREMPASLALSELSKTNL